MEERRPATLILTIPTQDTVIFECENKVQTSSEIIAEMLNDLLDDVVGAGAELNGETKNEPDLFEI